jgi:hypothetical protein
MFELIKIIGKLLWLIIKVLSIPFVFVFSLIFGFFVVGPIRKSRENKHEK